MRLATVLAATLLVAATAPGCRAESAAPSDRGRPAAAGSSSGDPVDAWDRVLQAHAEDGGLDYAALKRDRGDLDRYLRSLRSARPAEMSEDEALAFWVNAYNAVVVHHVLERYPGIRSVEDVKGFFDALTHPVADEELTLDEIEERSREIDPRAHFAVVCASTSCPDLRPEAYRAEEIEAQLEDQTRRFLSDESKGLRYDPESNTVWLSSIFKWYAGDFTGGSTVVAFFARGGVLEWVIEHAPKEIAQTLEKREPSVKYLDYDWSLNDR